jgi:hypothetical protein
MQTQLFTETHLKRGGTQLSVLASVGITCWLQQLKENISVNDAVDFATYALKLAYYTYALPGKNLNLAIVQEDGKIICIKNALEQNVASTAVYMLSVYYLPTDDILQSTGIVFHRKRVWLCATPVTVDTQSSYVNNLFFRLLHNASRIFCTSGERINGRIVCDDGSPVKTLPLR